MKDIIVVDDQLVTRRFLARLLGKRGYRVREAADGSEALELARAGQPDLVILDLLMPKMDGFEFVHRLRADPAIARTRVIIYTATYLVQEVSSMARRGGVSCVLSKSTPPDQLLAAIASTLDSPPPDVEPLSESEFNLEHLQLISGKLSESFRTVLAEMADLIGPDRAPGGFRQVSPTVGLAAGPGSSSHPRRQWPWS
jgi:two-component system cell cycle sensor histidine kinase/response regulator CckA